MLQLQFITKFCSEIENMLASYKDKEKEPPKRGVRIISDVVLEKHKVAVVNKNKKDIVCGALSKIPILRRSTNSGPSEFKRQVAQVNKENNEPNIKRGMSSFIRYLFEILKYLFEFGKKFTSSEFFNS